MWQTLPLKKWDKYNRRTVLGNSEYKPGVNWWKSVWYEECLCDCWTKAWIRRCSVRKGHSKSCWCLSKERIEAFTKSNIRHWDCKERLYNIYTLMRARCNNKNNSAYKYYWGRGIKCLWNSYEDFKRDMWRDYEVHKKEFWEKDTTIDRIDVNWNYCKENCKWATRGEQAKNQQKTKRFLWWWEYLTLSEIYNEEYPVVEYDTFVSRVLRGDTITKALFSPLGKSRFKRYVLDNK